MRTGSQRILTIGLVFTLLVVQAAFTVAQQGRGRGPEVRDLNGKLLEVYNRLNNLPAGAAAAAERSQAAEVIKARADALEALIKENPGEALRLAFSSDLLADLAAAVPDAAGQLESVGEWEGPVNVTVEDHLNLISHRSLFSMATPNGDMNLHFASGDQEDFESGDVRRIKGVRVRTEIAAADGGTFTGTSMAAEGACTTTGAQRSIVLMVYMPGTTPPNITTSMVNDIFFAPTGRSVSEFWRENSQGRTWAEGDVKGWYQLDTTYSCEVYSTIRDAAVRAADADVDFSRYNRVFLIISGMTGSCSWAGIANVGCGSTIKSNEGTFTMSSAWMLSNYFADRNHGVSLTIHEGGHSLGLSHASTRDFGIEALGAPDVTGSLSEYGDTLSAMGYWNFGHYAAPHKQKLGWINYATVSSNGSYSVEPTEYPSTLQALKIQRGTDSSKFLWVEFRKNFGLYDSTLPAQVFGGGLVHYQDAATGNKTHLLDFTTATPEFTDAALVGSWTDPYTNLSLDVIPGSSAIGVNVSYGAVPCVQSVPTVTLSPSNPSAYAGETVSYSVSVKNNDTSSCSARTFNMASLLPDFWPTSFAQSSITVPASSTVSTSMMKGVPAGTVAATYSVNAVASTDAGSTHGMANVTVRPPALPIAVTITAPATVKANSSAAISAKVMQGTTGAPGASVVFTINAPTGGTTTKTITTDSTGKASWNYKVNPKAAKGTYTVTANASLGSQTAAAIPATFVVQ